MRLSSSLRLTGWIGFWTQLVLLAIAGILLLIFGPEETVARPQTGLGFLLANLALLALLGGTVTKLLNVRIGHQLRSPDRHLWPPKKMLIRLLDVEVIIHWTGLILALIATTSILMTLMSVGFTLVPGIVMDPSRTIVARDLIVVLSIVIVIAGHFVGISGSLWILRGLLLSEHPRHEEPPPHELPPARTSHSPTP
jgi:hypothetical protein